MTDSKGYYSLVQYCPDRSRAEGVNVGVALYVPEQNYLRARTATDLRRVDRFFRRESYDKSELRLFLGSLESRLQGEQGFIRSYEDFKQFVDTRANLIRLIEPRPLRVEDPERLLAELFEELVNSTGASMDANTIAPSAHRVPELDALFKKLVEQDRGRTNLQVEVPIFDRHIDVPYAYKNGTMNLVKPECFPKKRDGIARRASLLAVEGDQLRRVRTPDHRAYRLIVVDADKSESSERAPWLTNLFDQYNVRYVDEGHLPEFLNEIEASAH